MLSFRALQAAHKTLLVIDSSSTCVQIGLFRTGSPVAGVWEKAIGEAGVALFQTADIVLKQLGVTLKEIDAIAFCEGPGSILGIRTAAVALRTWNVLHARPMFAFSSLGVVAEGLAKSRPGTALSVVADARRESWHRVRVNEQGKVSALERVPSDQLSGPLITPEGFRQWASPPPNLEAVHYDLRQWLGLLGEVQLFRPTEQPDAFLHEEPAYQTWTPRVHRAPS